MAPHHLLPGYDIVVVPHCLLPGYDDIAAVLQAPVYIMQAVLWDIIEVSCIVMSAINSLVVYCKQSNWQWGWPWNKTLPLAMSGNMANRQIITTGKELLLYRRCVFVLGRGD